ANNPYDSSLDCGACAGNPGGPNARVLAAICNDPAVRSGLRERGIDVPDDTVFLAAEHNTTTDEVELYDGDVPDSHAADLERLRADLDAARERAARERTGSDAGDAAVRETERRAGDWAETRPEWGLAGNAGFVVGPRELTSGLDLDGRAFLHSYDWATDPDGDALEAILAGPMVVTQWINAQYYFSTVDNAAYGSGSKATHNPVGNVGVYQGNGGDLMTGLPLQSVMAAAGEPYHLPLRLSTVVHAPVDRVTEVLADNEAVAGLLDNGWLSLTVVDPTRDHRAFHYEGELEWAPALEEVKPRVEAREAPAVADD
ncbi:MAG: putative inorganic carbon transporter subunit DabA, partial [Halorubrum sp.]